MKISTLDNMPGNIFLLLPGSSWIPYPLPPRAVGEDYLWVKTLGPGQLLLLCPEDSLLQSLVEGPQELASCQHTVTNSLDREETMSIEWYHTIKGTWHTTKVLLCNYSGMI